MERLGGNMVIDAIKFLTNQKSVKFLLFFDDLSVTVTNFR